jgi:uncharacterized protein YabE (DUF348 family)
MSAVLVSETDVFYRQKSLKSSRINTEGKMKTRVVLLCLLMVTGFAVEGVLAASGKCTVVKVDGTQMVIECNKETRGFNTGNQIKIKSDTSKADRTK